LYKKVSNHSKHQHSQKRKQDNSWLVYQGLVFVECCKLLVIIDLFFVFVYGSLNYDHRSINGASDYTEIMAVLHKEFGFNQG